MLLWQFYASNHPWLLQPSWIVLGTPCTLISQKTLIRNVSYTNFQHICSHPLALCTWGLVFKRCMRVSVLNTCSCIYKIFVLVFWAWIGCAMILCSNGSFATTKLNLTFLWTAWIWAFVLPRRAQNLGKNPHIISSQNNVFVKSNFIS